jgi:hypothetical protein
MTPVEEFAHCSRLWEGTRQKYVSIAQLAAGGRLKICTVTGSNPSGDTQMDELVYNIQTVIYLLVYVLILEFISRWAKPRESVKKEGGGETPPEQQNGFAKTGESCPSA